MTFYPSEHEKVNWSRIGDAAPYAGTEAEPCDGDCDGAGERVGECTDCTEGCDGVKSCDGVEGCAEDCAETEPCDGDCDGAGECAEDAPEPERKGESRVPYLSLAEMALEMRDAMNMLPDRQFPIETINAASVLLMGQIVHEALGEIADRLGLMALVLKKLVPPTGEGARR